MVDENETPRILDELIRNNAARTARSSERRKRNALRRVLIILLLFAPLLLGLLVLTYQTWNLNLSVQRITEENTRLKESLEAAGARIAALEEVIARTVPEQPAPPR